MSEISQLKSEQSICSDVLLFVAAEAKKQNTVNRAQTADKPVNIIEKFETKQETAGW